MTTIFTQDDTHNGGFYVNQNVRGKVAGHFTIIGFRSVGGTRIADMIERCPKTGDTMKGTINLPVDCLEAGE